MIAHRRLRPHERQELIRISKIQRLNCYQEIIRRLTLGESARSVARWAQSLAVEGPAGRWSVAEWQNHLWPVRKQVQAAKEKLRTEEHRRRHTVAPVPADPDAVIAQVELQTTELSVLDAIPESSREVWKHVDATLKKLSAEQILKYAFYRHMERVEVMVAIEKKLGILTPNGYKEIEALRSVAAEIHKVAVQELFLRGKNRQLPAGTDVSQPQLSDIAVGMAQFDEVDRNLLREAGVMVIDLIEEATGGRYKVGGLGANAPGKISAEETASEPAVGPDVPRLEKSG